MADAGRSRRVRTTADGAAGRCLSDLSDDLLRHILFLAPDRDGAATAVLSRRWRWLWRTSGAVYLDSRSFTGVGGAEEAPAAAAHGSIRRVTLFIAEGSKTNLLNAAVVSNPAGRRIEELRIEVESANTQCMLTFGSLPSEALRVLRILNCSALTATLPPGGGAGAAFPMLVDLHLENCSVPLVDLQSIIDASPRLSKLHLASSLFSIEFIDITKDDYALVIPAVSALVLEDCRCGPHYWIRASLLELDVPRLQYFRYRGHMEDTNLLSLNSHGSAGNMVHVDLHLTHANDFIVRIPPTRELFWRFLQNFKTTKLLKLRIDYLDDLALVDETSRDELLGGLSFSLVEQLELEAAYNKQPGLETSSMVMLADLLRCCPMVRDLRIKLTKQHEMRWSESSTHKEAGVHFDKSVTGFRNRRRTPLGAQKNDDNYEALGIIPSGLMMSEQPFSCLQSHLKRVSLQFFYDEPNCLGVQLAKFFAENAMVLQEININDGCHDMLEHANPTIRRWIAKLDKGNKQLNVND